MIKLGKKLPPSKPRSSGFSLIEIAIVLVIIGLLATAAIGIAAQVLSKQRRDTTIQRLAAIESSIALFVAQNKYLPCPALGTLDGTSTTPDPDLGREKVAPSRVSCALTNQQNGILPWVTLGLSVADAQDGWGNMFTYRVEESLIQAGAMDFTMCTPAGNLYATGPGSVPGWPNLLCGSVICTSAAFPACNSPTIIAGGRGLRVKSVNGTVLADPGNKNTPSSPSSTGAAYVVISHGENQAGSFLFTGSINSGTIASGTQELNNYAGAQYPANSPTAYLVDDITSYGESTAHFDDFVLRPTILGVAAKAQLGPRAY